MPLYEYQCAECDTVFETLRPIVKADAPIECANCGSQETSRMLSVFAMVGGSSSIESDHHHGGGGCACGGQCACGAH
jgi:putative FmdB family regulatory protein